MTNWKRTPSTAVLNRAAEQAYNDAVIARAKYGVAQNAYLALAESDATDETKHDAQKRFNAVEQELNDREAAADTAAQHAIDAIFATLDDDERYIYTQRVRRLDRMYRDPRYEWALLQDNEQYAIFTDDEWYAMDDAEVGRALGEDTFTFEFTADDNRTVYKWRDVELETLPDVSKRIEGQPSEILRTRREMVGMSITELANRAGITRTALSRLENGHTSLYRADATTVRNLADALGTSISILLPMR